MSQYAPAAKRLDTVNALRAIAALSVCIFHFVNHHDEHGDLFSPGHPIRAFFYYGLEGVYIFFVISGLVIPMSLDKANYDIALWWRFLTRRWLRLQPPYILSLIVVGMVAVWYALWDRQSPDIDFHRVFHHLTFTAPWYGYEWYQDIYWTLAVEFQYYIFIALAFAIFRSRHITLRLGFWLLFLYSSAWFDHDMKYVFFFHAPPFAIGIALWWYYKGYHDQYLTTALCTLASVETWFEISPATMLVTSCTFAIILWINWKEHIAQWLGDISYSIYLCHGFSGSYVLWNFSYLATSNWSKCLILIIAVMASILAARMFYWIIEKPSMRWASRISMSSGYKP